MEKNIFELMTKKEYQTKNGPISYWVNENKQAAATLIFLHGLTADHTLFEKQLPYFTEHFRLLCWDAPAHGLSRPYAEFSYLDAAAQLKNILEQEHIKEAIFIGQSMGGYIIQTFLKYYPTQVKAFIGIDTCPFGLEYYSKSDLWWLRQMEWMCMCFPHNILVKSIAKSCSYTDAACQNMMTALRPYSKRELCHLAGIGYAGFLTENCNLTIPCPVLILVGEHDKTGKVKQYCLMWHNATSYPLELVPNAAHNSNYDNSTFVNQKIEDFVSKVLP